MAVTTGMPRVKASRTRRSRRLNAAEDFDDDVGRRREHIVGTRGQGKAGRARPGSWISDERGGNRHRAAERRRLRARERGDGGADLSRAEQADADWRCVVFGRAAAGKRVAFQRGRGDRHQRGGLQHASACAWRCRPCGALAARATSSRRAEAAPGAEMGARNFVRPERSSRPLSLPVIGQEVAPWRSGSPERSCRNLAAWLLWRRRACSLSHSG